MTASAGSRFMSGGFEPKGKRTHGHGQECGDCLGGREVYGTKW